MPGNAKSTWVFVLMLGMVQYLSPLIREVKQHHGRKLVPVIDTFSVVNVEAAINPLFTLDYCDKRNDPRMYPVIAVNNAGEIFIAKDSINVLIIDTNGTVMRVFERPSGNLLSIRFREPSNEIELLILTSRRRASVYSSLRNTIRWRKERSISVVNPSAVEKVNMTPKQYDQAYQQVRGHEGNLPHDMVRDGLLFANESISIWLGIGFKRSYLIDHEARIIYRTVYTSDPAEPHRSKSIECFNISRWRGYVWIHGKVNSIAISSNRLNYILAFLDRNQLRVGKMDSPIPMKTDD